MINNSLSSVLEGLLTRRFRSGLTPLGDVVTISASQSSKFTKEGAFGALGPFRACLALAYDRTSANNKKIANEK
jgi:hypothetical protein